MLENQTLTVTPSHLFSFSSPEASLQTLHWKSTVVEKNSNHRALVSVGQGTGEEITTLRTLKGNVIEKAACEQ